jgi:hypothetical protein
VSDTDHALPADPDLRQVRFHVDEGSPGGFVGTIIEDPTPSTDPTPWLFYADGRLIARAHPARKGWQLQVRNLQFIESHRLTAAMLEDLFERGSRAPTGSHGVFARPASQHSSASADLNLTVLDIGVVATGPKPNHLVAAPHNGFRLDRGVLAESVDAETEEDEDAGIQRFGETPAEQVAGAVQHAELAKALTIPGGLQLDVLTLVPEANAVVLAIRETHEAAAGMFERRRAAGLPEERELATWRIDTDSLCDEGDRTFGGLCLTLEEVCTIANGLVPSLRALLDGEKTLMDLIDAPLTVLTYTQRGRLSQYHTSVQDLADCDTDHFRMLWPLLIETLERGEAGEDWDGERQRAFQVKPAGERHLARQLQDARAALIQAGTATVQTLPDPDGGFAAHNG